MKAPVKVLVLPALFEVMAEPVTVSPRYVKVPATFVTDGVVTE